MNTSTRVFAVITAILAFGTLSTSPTGAQSDTKLATLQTSGTMRVGITQTSPPWTYLGDDNKPAGYDVAVAKEVGRRIGVANVVFVADSFKNFIEGLRADKYDVVFNDLTPTPQREELVDFAEPYGVEDFRIFVRSDNKTIAGTDDLKGKSIGVTTGTTNETWSRAHLPQSTIKGYDNGSFVFQDLGNGRLDATIISHFGGLRYAQATDLAVKEVGPPLTYQLSAPALRKGEPALEAAISQAIRSMLADGTINTISKTLSGIDYAMPTAIETATRDAAGTAQ
jgi:L-cystine transport system substrate-binding protein